MSLTTPDFTHVTALMPQQTKEHSTPMPLQRTKRAQYTRTLKDRRVQYTRALQKTTQTALRLLDTRDYHKPSLAYMSGTSTTPNLGTKGRASRSSTLEGSGSADPRTQSRARRSLTRGRARRSLTRGRAR